jgi:2,3-bisphosphoglycerate-independent phosphoglycerate mutase
MVTLIILDGFGLRKEKNGNAIYSAGTPNLDKLLKKYPHTTLEASGTRVGLPEGQMGNSEVGHLTLGGGRVILQDLMKIDDDVKTGQFGKNPALIKALKHAEGKNLHIMGLLSDGGIHSNISHLFAILDYAKDYQIKNIFIHAFMDGRDTGIKDGIKFIEKLNAKIENTNAKIASISGRVFAMDREKRFERVEKAYKTFVFGENFQNLTAKEYILKSYENGVYDEFIEPALIEKEGVIKDGDSVIFFNYRSDRAIEMTRAITDKQFKEFKTKQFNNLLFSPMKEYSADFASLNTLYPPEEIEDNLSAIISQNNLKQFHIAETTKYAHVTFFFNGGIEKPYKNEERVLIDSIDVQDFSDYPKMRAIEITEKTLDAIASAKYDFILVNYSNPDMIGHTGNFNATKEAIACVEKQAYALALATLMAGGECIITADHGNAELMFDEKGNKITTHTTNPVPCIFVSEKRKVKLLKNGSIANIAPTILKMLDIEIPKTMTKPLF